MTPAAFVRGGYRSALAALLACTVSASLGAVPSAPTNLTAQVVGNAVTLTWTPSSAGPVLGYKLEAGTASGLSDVATAILGTTPAFTAASVPAGTYFVRVRAIGADGESQPSNEVIVVVTTGPACTAPPNPPANLSASVSGTTVTLAWLSGGGCAASNFVVQAGSGSGLSNVAIVNMGLALSLTASGPPGTYYVRVLAQNAFGSSGPSNQVIVQISSTGLPSPVCGQLSATLTSAPYGDPDKALVTLRFPSTTSGRAYLNFTSYRRVGTTWVEWDWWRNDIVFPPGSVGTLIDKPFQTAWRLEFRCDNQLLAQLEGPAGR